MVDFTQIPVDVLRQFNILGLEQLRGYRFAVQMFGTLTSSPFVAGFNELDGLAGEMVVRTVDEGGFAGSHKFPRRRVDSALTIRRGMTLSRSLYRWFESVANWTKGAPDYRRNVTIFMIDSVAVPVMKKQLSFEVWRWDVRNAWPSEWHGPRFNSMDQAIAFESVVLQHDGFSEAKGLFSGVTGDITSVII